MTDEHDNGPAGELPSLSDATRVGARRAGFHLLKAGYEVVTALGAFLEEVSRTRPGAAEQGPMHIPVEANPPPQRIPIEDDPSG